MILQKPTTKAKQRNFVDALTMAVREHMLSDAEIARHLRVLRAQLANRPGHKGRQTAPPTRSIRQKVLHLRATTRMSSQEIAIALRISSGRVSEILKGKRK